MKKIFQILILLILLSAEVNSQQFSLGVQLGTGTYSMSDLKTINEITMKNLPFNTKTVANFPPFINYSASFLFTAGTVYAGLTYSFLSTGSRVSGKDYSGEYRFDMLINSNSPGIYAAIDLFQKGKIRYSFYTTSGVMFSNLEIKEYLRVLETTLKDETLKFRSFNLFTEPGFKITYPFKFLDIGINAGYAFQYYNRLFLYKENKEIYLANPTSGNPVKPGWNGFRAGLSAVYTFK